MSKVTELKKQLEQAELEERYAEKERTLQELKNHYEGKAYGSRSFERAAKSASDTAVFFKSFYRKEGIIYADIWRVYRNRYGKDYKFSSLNYNYSRSRNEETTLTSDRRNEASAIYDMLPYNRVEISVDKFMALFDACIAAEEVMNEPFNKNVNANYSELIRMGDSNNEDRIQAGFKALNMDVLDMYNHKNVWEEIKYSNLPFFQEQRWLPRSMAKEILGYQVKLWEKERSSDWVDHRRYDAITRRINIVKSFIDTL